MVQHWKKSNSIKKPFCNENYFPRIDLNLPQYHLGPDLKTHPSASPIKTNWIQVTQEKTVIKPTNSYDPLRIVTAQESRSKAIQAAKICGDLSFTIADDIEELLLEDHVDVIRADTYDSKRDNVLAVAKLNDKNIVMLPIGDSQRELHIFSTETTQVTLSDPDNESKNTYEFPSGAIKSILEMNFPSCIRQIEISNAFNIKQDKKRLIIGVRTDISVALVLIETSKIDEDKIKGEVLHEYFPMHQEESRKCTPSSIALSPYDCYTYSFVGENGYFASFNIKDESAELPTYHTIEYDQNLKETKKLSQRWRRCGYGCDPEQFIIASPRSIMLLDRQGDMRKLYKTSSKSTRFYAFGVDKTPYSFFCVAVTQEDVVLLDVRYTGKVMGQWKHYMDDGPPTHVEIITVNGRTHIFAWDFLLHRVFTISFVYNASITQFPGVYPLANKLSLNTSQPIHFSKQEFKHFNGKDVIHMAGAGTILHSIPCSSLGSRPFCFFFRLMKDGRLKYQLMLKSTWGHPPPIVTGVPYLINKDRLTKYISYLVKKAKAAERTKFTKSLNLVSMARCILEDSLSTKLKPLEYERKIEPDKIQDILEDNKNNQHPSTLAELIERQGSVQPNKQQFFELYDLLQSQPEAEICWIPSSKDMGPVPLAGGDSLKDVLDMANKHNIPPIISGDDSALHATRVSTREMLNTKLAETISGNRIVNVPVDTDVSNTGPRLRFLKIGEPLTSVTNSARLLASEWTPGLPKTSHVTIRNQYRQNKPTGVAPKDMFPIPMRIDKRKRSVAFNEIHTDSKLEDIPTIEVITSAPKNKRPISMSSTQPVSTITPKTNGPTTAPTAPTISSQPVPGAFSERTAAPPKKKKKKVQGFK
ncbi:hypothetical protein J3Q64DRAFT_1712106 [Phycomyces blakesleeanus]